MADIFLERLAIFLKLWSYTDTGLTLTCAADYIASGIEYIRSQPVS